MRLVEQKEPFFIQRTECSTHAAQRNRLKMVKPAHDKEIEIKHCLLEMLKFRTIFFALHGVGGIA